MQLSYDSVVHVLMCSMDSEGLSRTLRHNKERNSLLVSTEEGAVKVLEVTAQRMDPLVCSNYFKVCKANFNTKSIGATYYFKEDYGVGEAPVKEKKVATS